MFDVKKETDGIIAFIRDYYEKNHLKGAVIGISGGKDSGVVAALFTKALGKENIVGVTMPCHTPDSCRDDAKLVAEKYGFELINVDLSACFDAFKEDFNRIGSVDQKDLKNSDGAQGTGSGAERTKSAATELLHLYRSEWMRNF